MSLAAVLVGVLNCLIVAAILVLVGAIIAWVASIFQWPIPWNIQRIYLLIVLLIFVTCVVSLLLGMPMVHFFRAGADGGTFAAVPTASAGHLPAMLG